MRIAFDLCSTRGQKTGIGVYTANLVRALRETAPELEIVELDDGAASDQRTDRRMLREQFVLPRLAARAGADILHLNGFAAPLRARCPVVLTVMDLIGIVFAENFPPASRFYWSRYLPFTLRRATRLIAISEHTKRDVVRLAGIAPARIRVIPPGRDERFHVLDDASLLAAARAELGLPAQFFLFVSTLEPRKGVDTLLAAYTRVAGQISQDLVIVGRRGWYWEKLFAQVARGDLQARVHFVDYLPHEKLPLVYNLARAFVFPSRYEGFGLPPLEAMACGTPVICSAASSLPEVVGDAGLLIPPDDVDGFANAMLRLARDEKPRAELRERGLKQAQKFSWTRAAREAVEVYGETGRQGDR